MKKIILIMFLLLVNLIYTRERSVPIEKTTEKNGITYVIDEDRPFTGTVRDFDKLSLMDKNIDCKGREHTREWIHCYKNGRLDKFSIIYYTDGKKWARGNYKGEKGETIIYFHNGEISERINYRDQKLDGEWITYSPDGKILGILNYKNGRRIN
ncbi:hypothetical protein NRK67_15730 [Fusobacteria bacterium ZRK30]|nr:hypothetical protein NRK67_15730 [Fusobacteria bacterium ZRK30]